MNTDASVWDPSPRLNMPSESPVLLAQNNPVPSAPIAAKHDTVFIQTPAAATHVRKAAPLADIGEMTERRDHFRRMQSTGFGLLMGGIACGAGGILLMTTGLNQANSQHYDQYGNATGTSDKGFATFMVGYIALVVATPALITTGIILNRVGNSRRRRYQADLDDWDKKVGVQIGLNSLRLTYNF